MLLIAKCCRSSIRACRTRLRPGHTGICERVSADYSVSRGALRQVGGFDFAAVVSSYYNAYRTDSDTLKSACMRWLRGEFATKTEAKSALPVGCIIDDDNWFD